MLDRGRYRADTRMRILLVNTSFPPEVGSAAHLYYDLAEELTARGNSVAVATSLPRYYRMPLDKNGCYHQAEVARKEILGSIDVLRIWTPRMPKDILALRGLEMFVDPIFLFFSIVRIMKRFNPDVALVYSPPLPLAGAAVIGGKISEVSVVTNIQDLYPKCVVDVGLLRNRVLIRIFEFIERFVYSHSRKISVHSLGNRDYVALTSGSPNKVEVIFNTSGLPSEDHELGRSLSQLLGFAVDGRFVAAFAGTMSYGQGLDVVLDAAKMLRVHRDILILMIGQGTERDRLEDKARSMGLDNVKFVDFLPRPQYYEVMKAVDAALVVLRADISPQVIPGKIQELMQIGKPLIASVPSSGDAADLIRKAECGIVVDAGNSSEIADALVRMRDDAELKTIMGNNGRSFARANFTIDAFASAYERLFTTIAHTKSGE